MKIVIKKMLKVIGFLMLIIITLMVFLIKMGIYMERNSEKMGDETNFNIEYKGEFPQENIDEEEIPDSDYYSTVEEALKGSEWFWENFKEYKKDIKYIIAKFENENYLSMYFSLEKNENEISYVFEKFKVKEMDGKKEYTLLKYYSQISKKDAWYMGSCTENLGNQLMMADFAEGVNINPESTRFVWGNLPQKEMEKGEDIKKLRVEGQKPDGIIEYKDFNDTWYFWYYEDLESDKPGSQLEYTLGREE